MSIFDTKQQSRNDCTVETRVMTCLKNTRKSKVRQQVCKDHSATSCKDHSMQLQVSLHTVHGTIRGGHRTSSSSLDLSCKPAVTIHINGLHFLCPRLALSSSSWKWLQVFFVDAVIRGCLNWVTSKNCSSEI